MNDGHLNNPERIHKRENNWYEDSVLRYMNNSIIIKDYRLERNKAELRFSSQNYGTNQSI